MARPKKVNLIKDEEVKKDVNNDREEMQREEEEKKIEEVKNKKEEYAIDKNWRNVNIYLTIVGNGVPKLSKRVINTNTIKYYKTDVTASGWSYHTLYFIDNTQLHIDDISLKNLIEEL